MRCLQTGILRLAVTGSLFVCLAAVGCKQSIYEVEMTPKGDGVSRKVTGWIEGEQDGETRFEPLPAEELARIAQSYGAEAPASPTGKQSFSGQFTGSLPDDVGGKGWYLHWENSLGSTTVTAQ
jgi:hypothetical protein